MVQFNLLPDVKLEYVKARKVKYLMTFIALIVSAVAVAVFLFALFIVNVVQQRSLSDLNKDIKSNSTKLQGTKDLDKILTVQNQLGSLTTLHENKPVASRLFGYITQMTPSSASINKLTVDFEENNMVIGGTAPTLDVVRVYTDTLKAAKYTTAKDSTKMKAFSEVVLSTFGRDDKGASFSVSMKYDPEIFMEANKTTLIVPTTATTSEANLFESGNK
ncbi:hypothetical protein JNM87_00885 [Candidatus Saccharibacteria bacterium]|nr:hypothetical protein [Candidatus Saccharibacteria bacterium]